MVNMRTVNEKLLAMNQRSVSFTIFLCTIAFVFASNVRLTNTSMNDKNANINTTDIMRICNETYPIKPEYLNDLNETGSFSDESEKVSMCYIQCFLRKAGVIGQDNQINKEKTMYMYQIEDDEIVDDCNKELVSASISDSCGKAYYFVRCIMTRMMLDRREGDTEPAK